MISYDKITRIHVELSSFCNASCPNCPRNFMGGWEIPSLKKNTMDLQGFKRIFIPEFLKQLVQVRFCGNYGDPMMCVDLPRILQYIRDTNPNIFVVLNTNGGMQRREWWSDLAVQMQRGPGHVVFSIDGLETTNHIYRRGVRWESLLQNVKSYLATGAKAYWEMLVFKHNEDQIQQAHELSQSLGFAGFQLKRPFGFEHHDGHISAMAAINKKGEHEYFIYESQRYANRVSQVDLPDPPKQPTYDIVDFIAAREAGNKESFTHLDGQPLDCYSIAESEIYVDASGGVHPCCWLGHVSQPGYNSVNLQYEEWFLKNVGHSNINALEHSLRSVVESDYFAKIQATWKLSHANGRPAHCSIMCAAKSVKKNLFV